MKIKYVIAVIFGLLAVVLMWGAFYVGFILNIGYGHWYELPYLITALLVWVGCVMVAVEFATKE